MRLLFRVGRFFSPINFLRAMYKTRNGKRGTGKRESPKGGFSKRENLLNGKSLKGRISKNGTSLKKGSH